MLDGLPEDHEEGCNTPGYRPELFEDHAEVELVGAQGDNGVGTYYTLQITRYNIYNATENSAREHRTSSHTPYIALSFLFLRGLVKNVFFSRSSCSEEGKADWGRPATERHHPA